MPFKKGQPRPKNAGRKKGQISKLAATVQAKLEELGCDPIEGMARIANDTKNPIEVRVKCYSEVAQYVYPKRKAVEHSGPAGGPIETNDVNIAELLRSRIAGIAERRGAGGSSSRTQ